MTPGSHAGVGEGGGRTAGKLGARDVGGVGMKAFRDPLVIPGGNWGLV